MCHQTIRKEIDDKNSNNNNENDNIKKKQESNSEAHELQKNMIHTDIDDHTLANQTWSISNRRERERYLT